MSPGLNPIIFATTNDYKDNLDLKVQDESTPDVSIEQPTKEDKIEEKSKASGVQGTCEWEIDSEGVLHIGGGNLEMFQASSVFWGWEDYATSVKKIVFEGEAIGARSLKSLFRGMSSLESIENLNYLDTSNVRYMAGIFAELSSLTTLDLSSFDTSNVEDMSSMFYDTSSLTTLDLSSFDTSNVTNMTSMFNGASSLTTLDLSNFDMSRVIYSKSMFSKTTSLSQLKLGSKVKFMGDEAIPEIIATDVYTGKWVNVGKGSVELPEKSKKWTSAELLANYDGSKDADTYVWEKNLQLEVQTRPREILLGTKISDIDPNDFIESVKLGDVNLSKNEYIVKIKNSPDTTQIGSPEFSLEVIPEYDASLAQNVTVRSSVMWGSTLVVKNNGLNAVDASVSLLRKEGKPYLNANKGSGFSKTTLTSRSTFSIYRNNTSNRVLFFSYGTVGQYPHELASKWNAIFESSNLQYGDVVVGYVNKYNGGANWKGQNTFISRNNTLITETVGYDEAYYELTPSGYRLLRLNQLTVNNNQKVKLNTSKEEMNKNISNFISLPEQIENPNHYRMEFESVDTASSGNKKSTINVYETLESGGEFKTAYEVAYSVNPEVTESYYDIDGKQIEQSQITEFEYGKEFTPNPEKYIENKGELYIYRGWVDTLPGTENIVPQEGVPEATTAEKSYYYIYDKADKFINVTLPTEVVFGTFENNNKISSKAYEIKNNSDEIPIEISLEQFDKVKSDIKLLSSDTPDPTQEEASAKLNLCVDNEGVIPGLTEDTPTQSITKIDTKASRTISLEGTYFGNMRDKNILDYKMHLKFKATQDNKN